MHKVLYIIFVMVMFAIAMIIHTPRTEDVDIYAGDGGIQLLIADHLLRYKDFRFDGEVSSFDNGGTYIIHNSPIGYYLYALMYLLGGKTLEGYLAAYYILSIVQTLFLFVFGLIVFGPPGAILTLTLSLFSRGAVMLARFPTPMTNAVFVESVAIGVFGLYIRFRRVVYFWAACLLSLLATQLYPPMYLLVIPKIVLFLFFVRRIPLSSTSLLTVGLLGLYINLPLLLQEYIYHWDNLTALRSYLSQSGGALAIAEIVTRFGINIRILFSSLSWHSPFYTTCFLIGVILFAAFVYRKKLISIRFIYMFLMLSIPAAILAFHPSQPYVVPHRAYLMITLPYVWLFVVSIASIFPKQIVYVVTALIFTISIWGNMVSISGNSASTGASLKGVVDSVVEDMKTRRVDANAFDLFVISPDDSWSWDAGLYWYELEQAIGRRLSRIAYESSKARRISKFPVQTIYLICHRIAPEDIEKQCKSVFEQERMENTYGELYRWADTKNVMGRSYIIYQQ